MAMKHKDLIELGFRLYGVEENDPYYKLIYRQPFKFGINSLSGVLDNGRFWLYENDIRYANKIELKTILGIVGGEILTKNMNNGWKCIKTY